MKKIGIIGAMESEVTELISHMKKDKVQNKASMVFHEGILGNTEVVIVKCGIGKVNAAICVQILKDLFDVSHIINTGVAGGLQGDISIGDIVISVDAVQHDVEATIFGYKYGQVPGMKEREFFADLELIEKAFEVNQKVNPDIRTFKGRIVSGDQFISDSDKKDWLISEFEGVCAEMEGAAIAHASFLNHIPFVVIRAVSDKADGSAHMDYPQFEIAAARHSARLVEALIEEI